MWERARRSKVPAIEVRASDYLGRGAVSALALLALPPLLSGKEVSFPGDPDATHAWSFTKDVARTLVAASTYAGEWGRAFHVPSQHISLRELVVKIAALRRIGVPRLRPMSAGELDAAGLHELIEMTYLLDRPFLVDASDTERLLGVTASGVDTMIEDTLLGHG
jgi:nucleoside-diphosphate-sugar epimerase